MTIEPELIITFLVTAYDCGGYGDNRSQTFSSGEQAVEYAKSLDKRFGAIVTRKVEMRPHYTTIYRYDES